MDDFDDFSLIHQLSRRELIHLLESIPGSKDLVVEQCLMRPLDKIASMSLLNQHGCPRVQQLHMERGILWEEGLNKRVFLCRPSVTIIRRIADFIRADPKPIYCVVLVDRLQNFCEYEFERCGVHGLVELFELNLYVTQLETDLFSLELPQPSMKSFLDQCFPMARALWQLQSLYGLIPVSYAFGAKSLQLEISLKELFADAGEPASTAERPIGHLLIFDRDVDLNTVFLTGLSYESILNDTFNYSCGKITFGETVEKKLRSKSATSRSRVIPLNNSDVVFSAIRNQHMTAVFPFLSGKAKSLQSSYDKASAMKNVDEVKSFVTNELKGLKEERSLLEIHICACEAILEANKGCNERFAVEHSIVRNEADPAKLMNFFESWILQQSDPWSILLMACLWSTSWNGIPTKQFDLFQILFLHSFGFEFASVFFALQNHRLLYSQSHPQLSFAANSFSSKQMPNFSKISKNLELFPKAGSATGPSYVFSDSYTPVVCRLLELIVAEGWQQPLLKKAFEPEIPFSCSNSTAAKPDSRLRKAILVCTLGGVTFAEVAALRRFAQDHNFRIIILTTHIINRMGFLKSYTEII